MSNIKLYRLIIGLFFCVIGNSVFSQDVTFTTSVDYKKIGITDRIKVTYSSNKRGNIILPKYKNFTVLSNVSTGTNSSVNFNTGVTKVTYSHSITLKPKKLGTLKLEGAKLQIGRATYQSKSVKVKVVKESQVRQRPQSLFDQLLRGNPQSAERVEVTNQDMFVKLEATKNKVYQNQPILLEYKLYKSKYRCDFEAVEIPTYKDFLSDEIVLDRNNKPKIEIINGVEYEVHTFKKVLLTPQKTGKLKVDAFRIQARVSTGSFFGTSIVMESNPLEIIVKELPKPIPTDFSNQVGTYSMRIAPLPKTIEKDNPIQLKVVIEGKGNLKQLGNPEINFPKSFEVFDPEISSEYAYKDSAMKGKVTFIYLIIPRETGDYSMPSSKLSYFDVATESYKTISTNEVKLKVVIGNESAQSSDDYDTKEIDTKENKQQGSSLAWLLIFPVILLILGILYFLKKRNSSTVAEETEEERRKNARKKLSQKLAVAKSHLNKNEIAEFYNEILIGLNKYVNEKLNIETAQMTKQTIRQTLDSKGVGEQTTNSFVEVLEQCEMAKYAPLSTQNNQAIYEKSLDVIEDIERLIS